MSSNLRFAFLAILGFIALAANLQAIDGWHCHSEENICHKRSAHK